MRTTCPTHLILLDLISITFGKEYKLCISWLYSFLHPPVLWSKYSPKHPVLRHPQFVFFPSHERPGSHPYKTTGKIIVLYNLWF
jgi:hypothetical protein